MAYGGIFKNEQFKNAPDFRPKEVGILSGCSILLSVKIVPDVFVTPFIHDVMVGIIKKERFKMSPGFRL